jgi:hypothetical protein
VLRYTYETLFVLISTGDDVPVPRLTADQYFYDHKLLWSLWSSTKILYSVLTPNQQQAVHDFYLPTAIIPINELLDYRDYITKLNPGLPQQAGKACKRLYRIYLIADKHAGDDELKFRAIVRYFWPKQTTTASGKRRVRVASIKQSQTNLRWLAHALINLEEQIQIRSQEQIQ